MTTDVKVFHLVPKVRDLAVDVVLWHLERARYRLMSTVDAMGKGKNIDGDDA